MKLIDWLLYQTLHLPTDRGRKKISIPHNLFFFFFFVLFIHRSKKFLIYLNSPFPRRSMYLYTVSYLKNCSFKLILNRILENTDLGRSLHTSLFDPVILMIYVRGGKREGGWSKWSIQLYVYIYMHVYLKTNENSIDFRMYRSKIPGGKKINRTVADRWYMLRGKWRVLLVSSCAAVNK